MRIKPIIVSLCAAALAASPVSAQSNDAQSNSVAKDKQAEQKKICKWLPATGSNRVERHCLTAEEWKKAEALAW